jgi:hypothetical protein
MYTYALSFFLPKKFVEFFAAACAELEKSKASSEDVTDSIDFSGIHL